MEKSKPARRHGLLIFQLSRGAALVAGVFFVVIATLLVSNYIQISRANPTELQILKDLKDQYAKNSEDKVLRDTIRELDQLARHAFFSSQDFKRRGTYLMFFSLIVLIGSLKAMIQFDDRRPDTRNRPAKAPLVREKQHAVRWVLATSTVVLVSAFLLIKLIPSNINPDGPSKAKAFTPPPVADFESNWPGFRGPFGNGVSELDGMPTKWDGASGEGIIWKSKLGRQGYNSPAIWGDRLFLSGADETGREVVAFDIESGNQVWKTDVKGVKGSADMPDVTPDTGHAAASVATDGSHVFAVFSNGDLICLDMDGKDIWSLSLGKPKNHYGHSSSLVVFEDLLLVQFDHADQGRFIGIDVASGSLRWEAKRDLGLSWASPVVINATSDPQVILNANPTVISYNPRTGEELWRLDCMGGEVAPSIAFSNGMVFAVNQYARLAAIDLASKEMKWEAEYDLPDISSPLAVEDLLFLATSDGILSCFDINNGEVLWVQEFDYGFHASPIFVDGKIYAMDTDGVMHIFKPDRAQYSEIAKSNLGEKGETTPAFYKGRMYYRGDKHLFCMGTKT